MENSGRAVVFELQERGVEVEVFNRGDRYIGKEIYDITYEEFNRYLKQGMDTAGGVSNIDKLYNKMAGTGMRDIKFPPGVVKWGINGERIKMTVLVGGKGFHTIDTVVMEQEGENKKNNVAVDFGGMYEVDIGVHLYENGAYIEIEGVYKFTGMIYREGRREEELKRIPYLEAYLTEVVQDGGFKRGFEEVDIAGYITNMKKYEHTQSFLDELGRVNNTKEEIDWGRIE